MPVYRGRCHCGAIGFELRTARTPDQWAVRACQCNFCRAHGARTTSDAEASVRFIIPDESRLNRYRFASKSADFYVCRDCGAYVASVIDSPRGRFATLKNHVGLPAQKCWDLKVVRHFRNRLRLIRRMKIGQYWH